LYPSTLYNKYSPYSETLFSPYNQHWMHTFIKLAVVIIIASNLQNTETVCDKPRP
jgi:hypothetical protein